MAEHLGGSSKLLRALNDAGALGHLLERGPLTRAGLRELTGLSKPTISEALRRLTEARLVTVVGHESGRPGPNAEIYAVDPDAAYAVALSIRDSETGVPSVAAAACDLTGAIRDRTEVAVDFAATDPVDGVLRAIDAVAAGLERVSHVQIAVPGSYDPRTDAIHHVDVPGWSRPGLVGELRARLGTGVAVDNDVNLAAIAERGRGVAVGADAFVLLWLGEGLGLAIDLGGTLLRGARGGAGEIGYMPMAVTGPAGSAGVAGGGDSAKADFHDLVGGAAVRALAAEYGIREPSPARAVAAAAGRTDGAARDFVAALATRVAIGLAAVVAVLDPPLVVLGGDVAQAGGPALGAAVAGALRQASSLDTSVAVTALRDDAPLLGAVDAGVAAVRDTILGALRQPTA